MGGFSNYVENKILDHVFKTAVFTQPVNLYLALTTTLINDTHTGTTIPSEVSGGGYARQTCNGWIAAASGSVKNNTGVTWAQATAVWGTVTDFAICTHSSTGQIIGYGQLTSAKHVVTDDTVRFATSALEVTLT